MENNAVLDQPPPAGDSEKAEKYLRQLIDLINQDKLKVTHTDLNKFNIESIQDHYRMDLGEYELEINHSKQPDSGQDFYVLLFNNLKKIEQDGESCVNKVILAYTHLTQPQFLNFKRAADGALNRIKQAEEQKRFKEAMTPIDDVLTKIASTSLEEPEESEPEEIKPEEKVEAPEEDLADFDDSPKASDYQTQSQDQPQATI